MKPDIAFLRSRWDRLSQNQALLFGISSGFVTTLVPALLFGGKSHVFGFIVLFPFFARLTLRAAFIGPYFHHFLATKYGMFCLGWFFTFMLLAWAFFDLS